MTDATITCPRCGSVSQHLKDVQERYCGRCHQFHEFMDADEIVVRRMARELEAHRSLELVMDAPGVLKLTGLVQLALRHPGVTPDIRKAATLFLRGVRVYFADCPAVLDVIRRGDDPAHDTDKKA